MAFSLNEGGWLAFKHFDCQHLNNMQKPKIEVFGRKENWVSKFAFEGTEKWIKGSCVWKRKSSSTQKSGRKIFHDKIYEQR